MSVTCKEIRSMARGEKDYAVIDWGENTAGEETGCLNNGDTVATCTVSVSSKPTGASDPTLGSVSANSTAEWVNGRECSAGEATTCLVTMAADQAYGMYELLFTPTTANSIIKPRKIKITVVAD